MNENLIKGFLWVGGRICICAPLPYVIRGDARRFDASVWFQLHTAYSTPLLLVTLIPSRLPCHRCSCVTLKHKLQPSAHVAP